MSTFFHSDLYALRNSFVCFDCQKQVHWSWTAVRMTILANVFAIGTIHGGMLTLYPYVLEVLIEILIAEQIIQGIQRWIEK